MASIWDTIGKGASARTGANKMYAQGLKEAAKQALESEAVKKITSPLIQNTVFSQSVTPEKLRIQRTNDASRQFNVNPMAQPKPQVEDKKPHTPNKASQEELNRLGITDQQYKDYLMVEQSRLKNMTPKAVEKEMSPSALRVQKLKEDGRIKSSPFMSETAREKTGRVSVIQSKNALEEYTPQEKAIMAEDAKKRASQSAIDSLRPAKGELPEEISPQDAKRIAQKELQSALELKGYSQNEARNRSLRPPQSMIDDVINRSKHEVAQKSQASSLKESEINKASAHNLFNDKAIRESFLKGSGTIDRKNNTYTTTDGLVLPLETAMAMGEYAATYKEQMAKEKERLSKEQKVAVKEQKKDEAEIQRQQDKIQRQQDKIQRQRNVIEKSIDGLKVQIEREKSKTKPNTEIIKQYEDQIKRASEKYLSLKEIKQEVPEAQGVDAKKKSSYDIIERSKELGLTPQQTQYMVAVQEEADRRGIEPHIEMLPAPLRKEFVDKVAKIIDNESPKTPQQGVFSDFYDSLRYGANTILSNAAKIPALAVSVGNIIPNIGTVVIPAIIGGEKPPMIAVPKYLVDNPVTRTYDKMAEENRPEILNASITELIGKGDISSAAYATLMQSVSQAPQYAIMIGAMMTGVGAAGIVAMGATSGAGTVGEDIKAGVKDPLQVGINGLTTALAEGVGESFGTFGIFKNIQKNLIKQFGKATASKFMKEIGKQSMYAFATEGNEEMWTELMQGVSDYATGNETALDGIIPRMVNAGIVGGVSGLGMVSPMATLSAKLQYSQLKQNQKSWEKLAETVVPFKEQGSEASIIEEDIKNEQSKAPMPQTVYIKQSDLSKASGDRNAFKQVIEKLGIENEVDESNADKLLPISVATFQANFAGTPFALELDNKIKFQNTDNRDAYLRSKNIDVNAYNEDQLNTLTAVNEIADNASTNDIVITAEELIINEDEFLAKPLDEQMTQIDEVLKQKYPALNAASEILVNREEAISKLQEASKELNLKDIDSLTDEQKGLALAIDNAVKTLHLAYPEMDISIDKFLEGKDINEFIKDGTFVEILAKIAEMQTTAPLKYLTKEQQSQQEVETLTKTKELENGKRENGTTDVQDRAEIVTKTDDEVDKGRGSGITGDEKTTQDKAKDIIAPSRQTAVTTIPKTKRKKDAKERGASSTPRLKSAIKKKDKQRDERGDIVKLKTIDAKETSNAIQKPITKEIPASSETPSSTGISKETLATQNDAVKSKEEVAQSKEAVTAIAQKPLNEMSEQEFIKQFRSKWVSKSILGKKTKVLRYFPKNDSLQSFDIDDALYMDDKGINKEALKQIRKQRDNILQTSPKVSEGRDDTIAFAEKLSRAENDIEKTKIVKETNKDVLVKFIESKEAIDSKTKYQKLISELDKVEEIPPVNIQSKDTMIAKSTSKIDTLKGNVNHFDANRIALSGVHFDAESKVVVATNGHYLVQISDNSITKTKTIAVNDIKNDKKEILYKKGEEIKESYPNYKQVIPIVSESDKIADNVNVKTLLDKLNGILEVNRKYSSEEKNILSIFTDGNVVNTQYLFNALMSLASNKVETVDVYKREGYSPLVIKDTQNEKNLITIMPLRKQGKTLMANVLTGNKVSAVQEAKDTKFSIKQKTNRDILIKQISPILKSIGVDAEAVIEFVDAIEENSDAVGMFKEGLIKILNGQSKESTQRTMLHEAGHLAFSLMDKNNRKKILDYIINSKEFSQWRKDRGHLYEEAYRDVTAKFRGSVEIDVFRLAEEYLMEKLESKEIPDGGSRLSSILLQVKNFFKKILGIYNETEGFIDDFLEQRLKVDEVRRISKSNIALTPTQIKFATGNIGTFDGNNPNIKLSKSLDNEIDEIRNKYQNTDKWLKGPNGKPTNLTELQWLQVRTQAFKNWFGDWENSPETASKVLDENGEPLVVYHGTSSKQFEVFDLESGEVNQAYDEGIGFFTTTSKAEAGWFSKGADDLLGSRSKYVKRSRLLPLFVAIKNPKVFETQSDYKAYVENEVPWNRYGQGVATADELIEKGHDGVQIKDSQFENDFTSGTWYVALSPTQIKSATGNIGTFDGNNPNIAYQLIGKKGATALDQSEEATTRLDNLSIAREMETAGKDTKAIRLATGWERGADKKWRYEIEDVKINDNHYAEILQKKFDENIQSGLINATKLGALYKNKALYNSYPELESMSVVLYENSNSSLASYNVSEKAIYIYNPLSLNTINNLKSTLLHEIQHAIQEIEGFAKGGSPTQSKGNENRLIREIKELSDFISDLENDTKDWQKVNNELNSLTGDESNLDELISNLHDELERIENETGLSRYRKDLSALNKRLADSDGVNTYKRLAGEVESRNVQTRMNLTPEQRRATLLQETEDVARKDQIFLDSALSNVSYSLSQDGVNKKFIESNIRFSLKNGEINAKAVKDFSEESAKAENVELSKERINLITSEYESVIDEKGGRLSEQTAEELLMGIVQKHIKLESEVIAKGKAAIKSAIAKIRQNVKDRNEQINSIQLAIASKARGLSLNTRQIATMIKDVRLPREITAESIQKRIDEQVKKLEELKAKENERASRIRVRKLVRGLKKIFANPKKAKNLRRILSQESMDTLREYVNKFTIESVQKLETKFLEQQKLLDSLMNEDKLTQEQYDEKINEIANSLFENAISMMTEEQLQQVIEDIKDIKNKGKTEQQAYLEKKKALQDKEAEAIVNEIKASMKKPPLHAIEKAQRASSPAVGKAARELISKYFVANLRPEKMMEDLSNNSNGELIKAVFNKLFLADLKKTEMTEKANIKFSEIFSGIKREELVSNKPFMTVTVESIINKEGKIVEGKKEIGIAYSTAMFVYGYSKNPETYANLIETGFTEESIKQIVDKLPQKFKDATDNMSKYFAEVEYPLMNEIYKKKYGVPMPKVDYYLPIANIEYRGSELDIMKEQLHREVMLKAVISKGMMKARTGTKSNILSFDFAGTMLKRMNKGIHVIAMNEAVTDARKLLMRKDVKTAIKNKNELYYKSLINWLDRQAGGKMTNEGNTLDRMADMLRLNFTTAVLGANVVTVLNQPVSFLQGLSRMKKVYAMQSIVKFAMNPKKFMEEVDSLSSAQKYRGLNLSRDLLEIQEKTKLQSLVDPSMYRKFQEYSMRPIQWADKITTSILWNAKYAEYINENTQAKSEEEIHIEAVKSADKLIRRTQSAGGMINLPEMYMGGGVVRAFTMFTNQFNQNTNLMLDMKRHFKEQGITGSANDLIWLILIPSLAMYFIANGFKNPLDEPEEFFRFVFMQFFGGLPIVGKIVDASIVYMGNVITGKKKMPQDYLYGITPTVFLPFQNMAIYLAQGKEVEAFSELSKVFGVPGVSMIPRIKRAVEKNNLLHLLGPGIGSTYDNNSL